MDVPTVYKKLAEHWHKAACETTNDTLRACYVGRAARYLEMAARDQDQSRKTQAPL